MPYFILIILTILTFSGCTTSKVNHPEHFASSCQKGIFYLKASKCIDSNKFIKKLEQYPVIFIGDHHKSSEVHNFTKEIIEELSKRGYKIHLANEWFTPSDNKTLASLAKKEFNEDEFKKLIEWDSYMTLDFSLFSPIYKAVIENGGELYGVNLSKVERKMLTQKSMPLYLEQFYNQLDANTKVHKEYVKPYLHCFKPRDGESKDECLDRMYLVQVAWDSMMAGQSAYLVHKKLKAKRDKLIVFVGSMHLAYGLGVNMRFARMSDKPFVTVMPQKAPISNIPVGYSDFIFLY